MNSVLPNMRLICLPSADLGEDWPQISHQIDRSLPEWGMDLAEERVYLIFDRAPGAVMSGEGSCLIGRSVIGPRRSPPLPFMLKDLTTGPVNTFEIVSSAWPKVYAESFRHWENLQRSGTKILPGFIICVKRELKPELKLSLWTIFNE